MDQLEKNNIETSVDEALGEFMDGLKTPSDPEPQPDNAQEPVEQPAEETEEAQAEPEEAKDSTEEHEADEVDEDAEVEEAEASEGGEETEAKPVTIEIDGEKLSVDEVKSGYLRQSDYTRKTAELAQERESLGQIKQQQVQLLTALEQQLREAGPLGYLQQQMQEAQEIGDTDQVNNLRWAIQDEQNRLSQVQNALRYEMNERQQIEAQQNQAHTAERIQAEREALFKAEPMLSDAKGQEKFKANMERGLKEIGVDPSEVMFPDHKHARLAYYAGLYFANREKAPQAAKALKGKAVMPSPKGRTGAKPDGLKAASDKFSKIKEPSLDDLDGLMSAWEI